MKSLLKGYGTGLVSLFFAATAIWAALLIILPQVTMLERAMTPPKRQLDSSIAANLERDAFTCIGVLNRFAADEENRTSPAPSSDGGVAVPSASGMAVPSASGMAVPSAGGNIDSGTTRPYILQCDRTTTRKQMVRSEGSSEWLNELYDLPLLTVSDTDSLEVQIETAKKVGEMAGVLHKELLEREANSTGLTLGNFGILVEPIAIPLSAEQKAIEDAKVSKWFYSMVGLRFERDGVVYERIGATTLTRTILFAIFATALALFVCYPIAFKLALATPPEKAVWLFLGLLIPYAIVELMRVYAWTSIIDNQGLLNALLDWLGVISLEAGEAIQFKRSAMTVFVVIVYTYVLFMVFPIYNVMSTLDKNQIEAARDLGANEARIHWRIIIPHSKPGIAVGCIATFMLAAGAFSVPRIISRGLQSEWFAQTIYNKFFESENSNVGAAYSFSYTFLCFVIVALFMYVMRTRLKDFARVQS